MQRNDTASKSGHMKRNHAASKSKTRLTQPRGDDSFNQSEETQQTEDDGVTPFDVRFLI